MRNTRKRKTLNAHTLFRSGSCCTSLSSGEVLLERTLESLLLGDGLEGTVSELGRGVDPLEADLLEGSAGGVSPHGLAEGDDTLLGTGDGSLNHDEVVLDITVADEATEAAAVSTYKLSKRA